MNSGALVIFAIGALALLVVSRRWAPLPLIAAGCYLGLGEGVEIGAFHFTTLRLLLVVGTIRVIIRGERLPGGFIGIDLFMVLWAIWCVVSCRFHWDPRGDLVFKLGIVFSYCGLYFLLRIFITSFSDLLPLARSITFALIPIAVTMLYEQATMQNLFSTITNVPAVSMIRDGKIRAFGPFAHPILAGTAGAAVLPFFASLWRHARAIAIGGSLVALTMVFASGSSGPVMSALSGLGALFFWSHRRRMAAMRWAAVCVYIVLDIVMKQPAYFIIARMDVTGSSTGWHRAALIQASIEYLDEWWFAGTDYTRHWMPSGVSWNPNHTDITNHYLQMGVMGGLPLMYLFIAAIALAFVYVGRRVKPVAGVRSNDQFVVWGLGSALFGVATTCVSVSFFDQSVMFLYLILAAIGSICHRQLPSSDVGVPRVQRRWVAVEPVCWGEKVRV